LICIAILTFIAHNEGKLSARKKKRFFEDLPEDIQSELELIVRDIFELG
jgi:hypothetical protein